MLRHRLLSSASVPLAALFFLSVAHPAMAGFQWVAPVGAPEAVPLGAVAPAAPTVAAPAPPSSSAETFANEETISSAAPESILPAMKPVTVGSPNAGSEVAPQISSPAVINAPGWGAYSPGSSASDTAGESAVYKGPVPDMVPGKPPMAAPEETVHAFAKNVPVVVAIRQILPEGRTFSIDPSVDMGTLVSFQGGKPWRQTLSEALAPAGLAVQEEGQTVKIVYAENAAAAPTLPPINYVAGMGPKPLQTSSAPPVGGERVAEIPAPKNPAPVPSSVVAAVAPPASTPSPAAAPGPDASVDTFNEAWVAERGSSLHKVLDDWCRRSHVEFNWLAEYDYPINASVSFTGSFQDAVRAILTGFEGAHPQPVAELHTNASLGQMVLVVRTRGNSDTD